MNNRTKIVIKRSQNQPIGHIFLYVYAWRNKDFIRHKNQKILSIKLDFGRYDCDNLLKAYDKKYDHETITFNPLEEEDNNITHKVILYTSVTFRHICKALLSKYATNINYRLVSNNCVDSVLYALKVANLKINLSYLPIHKRPFAFFTNRGITSLDLITALKAQFVNITEEIDKPRL